MSGPRAPWCMTMAIDEQIQNRLLLAQRLLVLEIEHRERVRAEQLDDSEAEKAVRLRQAFIERIQRVMARRHPTVQLRAG
jgi:coenzyme F420-reducing hydrogenase delta subunit